MDKYTVYDFEVGKYYMIHFGNGAIVWGKIKERSQDGPRLCLLGPWVSFSGAMPPSSSKMKWYRSSGENACITSGNIPIDSVQEITKEQFDCVKSFANFEY